MRATKESSKQRDGEKGKKDETPTEKPTEEPTETKEKKKNDETLIGKPTEPAESTEEKKEKSTRKVYTTEEITLFFDDCSKNPTSSVASLARKHSIKYNTARKWIKDYLETGRQSTADFYYTKCQITTDFINFRILKEELVFE
ncbi:hypothetical protein QCA50_013911 [Cerrena zonata]|uniref:Helix-turn-helix domain-containing protein n=1 Tax=Cerrena zonata TaxID=2478898 RepID=A0AAW0FQ51_9APHY